MAFSPSQFFSFCTLAYSLLSRPSWHHGWPRTRGSEIWSKAGLGQRVMRSLQFLQSSLESKSLTDSENHRRTRYLPCVMRLVNQGSSLSSESSLQSLSFHFPSSGYFFSSSNIP